MDQFTSSKSLKWIIFPAPSMADSAGCLMCECFRHFWKGSYNNTHFHGDVINVMWEVIAR